MTDLIKQHLDRSKTCMKKQADQKRSERQFSLGDMVFLKLQPYVQTSLAPRYNKKLAFKFFGPYKILSKIRNVAYWLDLPATTNIHSVFHVSRLKPAVSSEAQVTSIVPSVLDIPRVPLRVIQQRTGDRGGRPVGQVPLQWSGLLATWEDAVDLQQAPAWGQAGSQEGGVLVFRMLLLPS
jgi:hypothetical protein